MKYLLDTDTCVHWLRGSEQVLARVTAIGASDLAISAVTLAELWYGARCSAHTVENQRAVLDLVSGIPVLEISEVDAMRFGDLKAHLQRSGMLIEDLDLLIAASALARDLVLVTNNTQHFRRVPGLTLENWILP